MEVFKGEQQACPCSKECQEFHKLLELNDAGLVVYCHRSRPNDGGTSSLMRQRETVGGAVNPSEDVFILYNKKNVKVTTSELMSEFEKKNISCPRCKKTFEHAQELMQKVKSIDKKVVMGICDHCRKKTQTTEKPFCDCDEIVKKFIHIQGEQTEDTEEYDKILQPKIGYFRTDAMLKKQKKTRTYSDLQINLDLRSQSGHEPDVRPIFHSHKDRISVKKEISEIGFRERHKKQKETRTYSDLQINLDVRSQSGHEPDVPPIFYSHHIPYDVSKPPMSYSHKDRKSVKKEMSETGLRERHKTQKETRTYSDLQINLDYSSRSRHEPDVQPMFYSHTDLKSAKKEISESGLKERHKKQTVAFIEPTESHVDVQTTIPAPSLAESGTSLMEPYPEVKAFTTTNQQHPKPSIQSDQKQEKEDTEVFEDIPSMDAKEALKRRHDLSLRQMMKSDKDTEVPQPVSKKPEVYETPKTSPWERLEKSSKYLLESKTDVLKIPTPTPTPTKSKSKQDRGARDLDDPNRQVQFRSSRSIRSMQRSKKVSSIEPSTFDKNYHDKKLKMDEEIKLKRSVDKISRKMKKTKQVTKSQSEPDGAIGGTLKPDFSFSFPKIKEKKKTKIGVSSSHIIKDLQEKYRLEAEKKREKLEQARLKKQLAEEKKRLALEEKKKKAEKSEKSEKIIPYKDESKSKEFDSGVDLVAKEVKKSTSMAESTTKASMEQKQKPDEKGAKSDDEDLSEKISEDEDKGEDEKKHEKELKFAIKQEKEELKKEKELLKKEQAILKKMEESDAAPKKGKQTKKGARISSDGIKVKPLSEEKLSEKKEETEARKMTVTQQEQIASEELKKLKAAHLKEKETRLKEKQKQLSAAQALAQKEAKLKARKGELKMSKIKMKKEDADAILKSIRLKQALKMKPSNVHPEVTNIHKCRHKQGGYMSDLCPLCLNSELELDVLSLEVKKDLLKQKHDIIIGEKISKFRPRPEKTKILKNVPIFFQKVAFVEPDQQTKEDGENINEERKPGDVQRNLGADTAKKDIKETRLLGEPGQRTKEETKTISGKAKTLHKDSSKTDTGGTGLRGDGTKEETKTISGKAKGLRKDSSKTDSGGPEPGKGSIRYALSDRTFIDKGWTMLPTEKVVRKMNVYRMRPARPEFDWFEHNKSKRQMSYDTGERLAEFDDNGRGRLYYRSGRLALDYYDAEETNAQQRFVVYSSGEPDERGRTHPITILATFDYLGNGIVFDHSGKIRLKYNQTEGVVLDRAIGPVTHWQWHSLNDPPVLQQVMIDTQISHKDPNILKLGPPSERKEVQTDNEEMLAIEFDNFIREKTKKLSQKFKPFQIKMKAMKINEHFSLKVLDQATVYLLYRDGTTNMKLNIGMLLDHKEIVDTETADVGEVSNSLERFPARTDSLAMLQNSVAHAQHYERQRTIREQRLRAPVPCASVDILTAAVSPPMKLPLRTVSTVSSASTGYSSRKPTNSLYYNTRFLF